MRREAFARTTARAGIVVPERRQRREKRPGEGGLPPRRSPACRGNIVGKGAGVPGGKPGDTARRKKPERLTTLRQPKNN